MEELRAFIFSSLPSYRSEQSKKLLWFVTRKLFAELGMPLAMPLCLAEKKKVDVDTARKLTSNKKGEVVRSLYVYTACVAKLFDISFPDKKELPKAFEKVDKHLVSKEELEQMWAIATDKEKLLVALLLTTGWRASAVARCELDGPLLHTIEKGGKEVCSLVHPLVKQLWKGNPFGTSHNVYNAILCLRRRANLGENVHPHAFRHSSARMSLNLNHSAVYIQYYEDMRQPFPWKFTPTCPDFLKSDGIL